jgi:putative peptidoglycan lipid II flippase
VGLIVLAHPIVELLFEHGRFTAIDTESTASALRLYALGLIGYSAARIVAPTFYALRQSRTAVAVSVAAVVGNILFSVALVGSMGFRGLALATSIAAVVNGALLVGLMRRRLDGIGGDRLAIVAMKVLIATAAMALAAWGAQEVMIAVLPGNQALWQSVRLAAAIGGGLVVLAATAKVLRLEEFEEALAVVTARLAPNEKG